MRINRYETFNSTSFWYKAVNTETISIYDYLDDYTSKFHSLESIKLSRLRAPPTLVGVFFHQYMCILFQKMQFRVCFLKMFRPLKGWYVLF